MIWPNACSVEVHRPKGHCIITGNNGARARFGGPGGLPLPRHLEAALEVAEVLKPYFPEITGFIDDLKAELPAAQERE